ncbi:response regulator [Polaromonas glacialis]|uniref:response regulator n=1 Tax=Polaromonas glacialis TaxID=866564 RepID=UPI0004968B6F|nr:response regulator [Polaromonas glacialis]
MSAAQSVMVVEDNDEDFETVVEAARRTGIPHRLHRATSGGECLGMLQASVQSHSPLPALLLLDLNTPGDDGRDALRLIKTSSQLRAIPTVVLSTSANPRDVDFCYAMHANAYHTKPVSHPAHLKIMQDIFSYWLNCALLPSGPLREKP